MYESSTPAWGAEPVLSYKNNDYDAYGSSTYNITTNNNNNNNNNNNTSTSTGPSTSIFDQLKMWFFINGPMRLHINFLIMHIRMIRERTSNSVNYFCNICYYWRGLHYMHINFACCGVFLLNIQQSTTLHGLCEHTISMMQHFDNSEIYFSVEVWRGAKKVVVSRFETLSCPKAGAIAFLPLSSCVVLLTAKYQQ